jgi:phosphoglycerate dehydrogenase-like enzyme
MDDRARPGAEPPVLAVVGTSADALPAGLPAQWPGYQTRFVSSGSQLATEAAAAEIVFLWERVDWLRESWGWSDRLRWVAAPTAGVDWLLFPELVDSEVVVTNAAGVFDAAMAEYTLALVSAITVDLPGTLRLQARREWRHRETNRLAGRRAVILGAGGIGRSIHRMLSNCGLSAKCVARHSRNDPVVGPISALAELPGLLPGADFVILALPLTESTRGLIGPAELDPDLRRWLCVWG